MKHVSPLYVVPNPSYSRWCLIFFYVWEGIGGNNAKHQFAQLMGKGAWQHYIFRGPSCGRQLTYETRFTFVGGP